LVAADARTDGPSSVSPFADPRVELTKALAPTPRDAPGLALANQIVKKVKFTDETGAETCIRKHVDEIKETLQRMNPEYEENVINLSTTCEDAEMRILRINETFNRSRLRRRRAPQCQ
jgi:hypothetical protein